MEVSVDRERGFVKARLVGLQTRESFEASFDELAEHPDFEFSLNRLWDAREAELKGLSADDLLHIQSFLNKRHHGTDTIRGAVLVSKDIDHGIGNMFRLMTRGQVPAKVRIFRDLDEAVDWVSKSADRSEDREV